MLNTSCLYSIILIIDWFPIFSLHFTKLPLEGAYFLQRGWKERKEKVKNRRANDKGR
jgi:hypothetical protein